MSQPNETLVNEKTVILYGWTASMLAAPVPDNDYGLKWGIGIAQYFKEAYMYRHTKGLHRLFHMVNMIKLDLPFFQFTSRGYINTNALHVLKACCDHHKDLGIAGAASTGKTFPVGAYILQDWKSAPDETLSFVCTTDMGASEDRIWGAIIKMWQNSSYQVGTYIPHKHVIAWGNFSDSASDRDFNSAIKALAIPRGQEGKKAIDITRGRKQKNVRLVFDELPEMDTYVTLGAVNLESNNPDESTNAFGLQVIGIGNPVDHNDAHGQMCRPDHPLGYDSINKNVPEWKTETGWCIFLSGEMSPNFQAPENEPIPFPRLTSRVTLAAMLTRCHGNAESIDYYRNAIGFWPTSSVIQTVITVDLLKSRGCNLPTIWRTRERTNICGFDTGFTAGGDKCVATFTEMGENDKGRKVLSYVEERVYMAPAGTDFEDSIAQQIVPDLIRNNVDPFGFGMDISSDGGKVMKAILTEWLKVNKDATQLHAISSMGRPTDRLVSTVDPRKCSDVFDRRVTEYWMMIRESALCQVLCNIPLYASDGSQELSDLVKQLSRRMYFIKSKKFVLETKKDMKDRTAEGSPDNADSLAYNVEVARRNGLVLEPPSDFEKRIRAMAAKEFRSLVNKRIGIEEGYSSDSWGEDD